MLWHRAWYLWLQHKEGSRHLQLQRQKSSHQEGNQVQGKYRRDVWRVASGVCLVLCAGFLYLGFCSLPLRMMSWHTFTLSSCGPTKLTRSKSTMRRWSRAPWKKTGTSCPNKRSKTLRQRSQRTGTIEPKSMTPRTASQRWDGAPSSFSTPLSTVRKYWDKEESKKDFQGGINSRTKSWSSELFGELVYYESYPLNSFKRLYYPEGHTIMIVLAEMLILLMLLYMITCHCHQYSETCPSFKNSGFKNQWWFLSLNRNTVEYCINI